MSPGVNTSNSAWGVAASVALDLIATNALPGTSRFQTCTAQQHERQHKPGRTLRAASFIVAVVIRDKIPPSPELPLRVFSTLQKLRSPCSYGLVGVQGVATHDVVCHYSLNTSTDL